MTKAVQSILRQVTEPMTTRDIAVKMIVSRALDKNDQRLLALMTERGGVALRLQWLNNVVRSSSEPGSSRFGKSPANSGYVTLTAFFLLPDSQGNVNPRS